MDHAYIDDHAIAERYLKQALPPAERTTFETHLVDCVECADRVLLAEMFYLRNGARPHAPAEVLAAAPPQATQPEISVFVSQWRPWQIVLLIILAGALLLAVPTAFFLWKLHQLELR